MDLMPFMNLMDVMVFIDFMVVMDLMFCFRHLLGKNHAVRFNSQATFSIAHDDFIGNTSFSNECLSSKDVYFH